MVKKYIGNDTDSDAKKFLKQCQVARPDKANKQKWWDWLTNLKDEVSNAEYGHVCGAFTIGLTPEFGKTFADSYFEFLPRLFSEKSHFYASPFCHNLYPGEYDPSPEYLEKLEQILNANNSKGDDRNKFLEDDGTSLQDIQYRFQTGWQLTDPADWPEPK